jgi:hypothetical protein
LWMKCSRCGKDGSHGRRDYKLEAKRWRWLRRWSLEEAETTCNSRRKDPWRSFFFALVKLLCHVRRFIFWLADCGLLRLFWAAAPVVSLATLWL